MLFRSTATANATAGGPYTVSATVIGFALPAAIFKLTNTAPVSLSVTRNCMPNPLAFTSGLGSGSVSCPGFTVPVNATLTGVSLAELADYQFGSLSGPNAIAVTFTPAGPSGVAWSANGIVTASGKGLTSDTNPPAAQYSTNSLSQLTTIPGFTVNIVSTVTQGSVTNSSAAVMVTYSYTP